MNETDKNILHARPRLRIVSPLAYWITCTLGAINVALGIAMFFLLDQARFNNSLLIVNTLLTFKFWGIAFFSLGVFKLLSLKWNDWDFTMTCLKAGVVLKSTWAIGLLMRTFVAPVTVLFDLIWVGLTLIEVATFVFFMPPGVQADLRDEEAYNA